MEGENYFTGDAVCSSETECPWCGKYTETPLHIENGIPQGVPDFRGPYKTFEDFASRWNHDGGVWKQV